jgi:signal transduction histidine kinase
MSQRLHDEDERKRRLIIDVSHELRSPLARLRALGETITRLPHEAAPYLVQLESEIALMDRLVGDMLDATRFAEGRSALVLERCLLSAWVSDAFARQRRRIEEAGVRCETHVADSDIEADIDPQRLMQTLSNLVENALQATRGHASPSIEMTFKVHAGSWTLGVNDNGRGIPPDELPRVFDRFYRVERDRGRVTGGVGLGLAIAKAIVEGHGGRISISSTLGQGTQVQQAFG